MISRLQISRSLAAVALVAAPLTAMAQGPAGPPAGPAPTRAPGGELASFLLARVVDLKLTDAQVTRIAGIARRSDEQSRPLVARLDSMRRAGPLGRPDSVDRARVQQRRQVMETAFETMQEQRRVATRDAIAVLTPDQQARLYELREQQGRIGRPRMMTGGDVRMRRAPARPGVRGRSPAGMQGGPRRGPGRDGDIGPERQGDDLRPRRPKPPEL